MLWNGVRLQAVTREAGWCAAQGRPFGSAAPRELALGINKYGLAQVHL